MRACSELGQSEGWKGRGEIWYLNFLLKMSEKEGKDEMMSDVMSGRNKGKEVVRWADEATIDGWGWEGRTSLTMKIKVSESERQKEINLQ